MSEYNNGELLKPIHNPVNPTDLICPIDRSVINCSIEYDYFDFNCVSCGAVYKYKSSQDELMEQAKTYVERIKKEIEIKSLELGKLEKIVRTARHNGV